MPRPINDFHLGLILHHPVEDGQATLEGMGWRVTTIPRTKAQMKEQYDLRGPNPEPGVVYLPSRDGEGYQPNIREGQVYLFTNSGVVFEVAFVDEDGRVCRLSRVPQGS